MRVLYDTNILISFLLLHRRAGTIAALVMAALERQVVLLVPADLLTELITVTTTKPYLAARIPSYQVAELVQLLMEVAEVLPTIADPFPQVSRDVKDNYLLAYAVVNRADYLVTGDTDLSVFDAVEGVKIVSPAQFAALLRQP